MRVNLNKFIFLAAAAALAACGPQEPKAGAEPAAADGQPVTAVVKAEKPGVKTAYEKKDTYFSVPALAGGKLDLAEYAGKPVLFMLFTETCPYCRKAAPALEKMHKTYSSKGLMVLGLCVQDDPSAPRNFAADLGATFPMGFSARQVYKQYRAQGVPFIFLLDREHKVSAVWPGYTGTFDEQMVKAIEKALAA